MKKNIAILAGDGIGPEVMKEAIKVLDAISKKFNCEFSYNHALVGGAAIDEYDNALPPETLDVCKNSDAILFGSVGGPKWENLPAEKQPERAALLPLRKIFDLYCNLRPAKVFKKMASKSPLHPNIVQDGFDILCIRELTGGIYFGQPKGRETKDGEEIAYDTLVYTKSEIERITKIAFQIAQKRRKKICSVDKANVLTSMVFWREIVTKISAKYPDVKLEHIYIDNCTMQLISRPRDFDVLLCPNMFGDIISDECAMITGSIGLLPSCSMNETKFGLYEPAGGSAPDIAGKNLANPIAQILSAALMLRYTFEQEEMAATIEKAVERVFEKDIYTMDLAWDKGKYVTTNQMGDEIVKEIENN